jgi:hypothetical protein
MVGTFNRTKAQIEVCTEQSSKDINYRFRATRKAMAEKLTFEKTGTQTTVYYKNRFVCHLFDSDSTYHKRQMMNAIFNIMEYMTETIEKYELLSKVENS